MTIEALSFSQEQISNMMHFNRALTDVKELEETGDSAIEFKRMAFDHYLVATDSNKDKPMLGVARDILLERGIPQEVNHVQLKRFDDMIKKIK